MNNEKEGKGTVAKKTNKQKKSLHTPLLKKKRKVQK